VRLGSASLGSPSLGSPSLGSPSLGSPSLGRPSLGSPSLGRPSPRSGSPIGFAGRPEQVRGRAVAERVGVDLYYSGHLFRGAARARARAVSAWPSVASRGQPCRSMLGAGAVARAGARWLARRAAPRCHMRRAEAPQPRERRTAPGSAGWTAHRAGQAAAGQHRGGRRTAPGSAANATHLDRRGLSLLLAPTPRRGRAATASIAGRRPAHSSNVHRDEGAWGRSVGLFLFFREQHYL